MNVIGRHTSPDGRLVLMIVAGGQSDIAIGSQGDSWRTHPNILSVWLEVPEALGVGCFGELLKSDQLMIVLSTDGGRTIDPFVSHNLSRTFRLYGKSNCILRVWSGARVPEDSFYWASVRSFTSDRNRQMRCAPSFAAWPHQPRWTRRYRNLLFSRSHQVSRRSS
jgi:hypothetical protein